MRFLTVAAIAAMAFAATSVNAQDAAGSGLKRGQYISVYGGQAGGFDYEYGSRSGFDGHVEAKFGTSAQFGIAYGYVAPNGLRFEMAVSSRHHDLEESVGRFGDTTYSYTMGGGAKVLTLDLNGYYDIPVSEKLDVYVGGGVGVADVDINDHWLDDKGSALSLMAAAGVSYEITEKATVFVEGRWQRVGSFEVEASSGHDFANSKIDLSNTVVLGGVRFNF